MELFNFSAFASQIFWLAIFFVLQYLLLAKLVVPKMKVIFDRRNAFIDLEINKAEELTGRANALKRDFEEKIAQAQNKSVLKMNEAMAKIKKDAEQQVAKLEESFTKDALKQELKLQKFCFSMQQELENISLSTAVMMINKITSSEVKRQDLQKYLPQ